MRPRFRFGGEWLVDAPMDAVQGCLADLAHYPDWWPEVRAVARMGPREARALVRSRLPYTLDLVLHAEEGLAPGVLHTDLAGDLVGWARWELAEQGDRTRLTFAQEVMVSGRLFDLAARVARPLLVWNHDQMMASAVRHLPRAIAGQ